jgi:hypothetical protein
MNVVRVLCAVMAVLGMASAPNIYEAPASGQSLDRGADDFPSGRGADPCKHLPDPRGKARGHDDRCPAEGSSSGVARGDFNGDGFADLAVGVPFEDIEGDENAGAVHVIYGSANGLTETGGTTGLPAPQFWHQSTDGVDDVPDPFDQFGRALAAGNFNGDDFSDLAIGVPGEDIPGPFPTTGAVYVLFGSADGLSTAGDQSWTLSDLEDIGAIEFPPADTEFGAGLVWGDFNGDTVGDLAIGIPGAPSVCDIPLAIAVGCHVPDAGRVLILFGAADIGLGTDDHQFILQNHGLNGSFIELGDAAEESDRFGSVLAAGRFDADAFDDLVIGVPREDLDLFLQNAGLVHIAFGSANGIGARSLAFRQGPCSSSPGVCIPNAAASGDQFGRALAVGDFDGDALADLAVGTPFEDVGTKSNAGAVYVLYGFNINSGLPASVQAAQTWHQNVDGIADGAAIGDHFGIALAAGDFNGDNRSDLAIGVPEEDTTDSDGNLQADAGAVHVIYGTATGLHESGDQFFTHDNLGEGRTAEGGDRFGASLTAWNFGRNERRVVGPTPFFQTFRTADLAIGVPGEDLAGLQAVGAVSVLYGHTIDKLKVTGNQLWHQTRDSDTPTSDEAGDQVEANDQFGSALY